VIHRDIKPGNILLHDGRPVVADFGIALAVSAAGGGRMTETGLSLGTPHYMSPEQASADRDLSARSDVYSLGCVLYEMIGGQPPHTGPSAQSILVHILTEEAKPLSKLRHTVPPHVAATVAKSIEKLPADRFESAKDFMEALGDEGFVYQARPRTSAQAAQAAQITASPTRPALAKWLPWSVAAVALLVACWSLLPTAPAPAPPTFRMGLSDFVVEAGAGGWRLAISRDGATLVAAGADDLLYIRRSDDTEFRPIPGTEGGRNPSISPDGEWLVFEQDARLNKVQLGGGPVLPVTSEGLNPHWYTQDEIVYRGPGGAYRVSSAGGQGTLIVEGAAGRPFMLPGAAGLVADGLDGLYLHDLDTGEGHLIAAGGTQGRYVPTGYILYGDRQLQSVLSVPFDLETLEVTGSPVPVLPSVNIFGGGAVQLAVSDNGTLVHGLAVTSGGGTERLTWVAMDGTPTDLTLDVASGQVLFPRISPDGTRLAYQDATASEVFVYDFNTGERTQVTQGLNATYPVWSPDGSGLYVTSSDLWLRTTLDGSAAPDQIAPNPGGRMIAVSPDESWVVVEEVTGPGNPNLLVARLGVDPVVTQPYLRADWHEEDGVVSPDGDWLVYVASEGDTHNVYIRAFPEPGPAIRVSSDQGNDPTWAPDGSAVYYRVGQSMMQRSTRLGETVELGDEEVLFSAVMRTSNAGRMSDIHPDGDRLIFVTTGEVEAVPDQVIEGIGPVVVVLNWFTELRERMGEN
jgi:serine/threonine-protein kinase